jgi:carbamoylphosphate synthase small subunit
MTPIAAVYRVSTRVALQQLRSHGMRRGKIAHTGIQITTDGNCVALHSGQASLAAQNFNMPALSPTMTEGNIATWKLKEGTTDPFPKTTTRRGFEKLDGHAKPTCSWT